MLGRKISVPKMEVVLGLTPADSVSACILCRRCCLCRHKVFFSVIASTFDLIATVQLDLTDLSGMQRVMFDGPVERVVHRHPRDVPGLMWVASSNRPSWAWIVDGKLLFPPFLKTI